MHRSLALTLAEFLQFNLRRSALDIDLGSVIPITAVFTFQPDIFTLLCLRHSDLSENKVPQALFTVHEGKKDAAKSRGTRWFGL
jgi:hypothetical protein